MSATSARYLVYLLSTEILQFFFQLKDRLSHIIKREERADGDAGYVCRFRRFGERLETLQGGTKIKTFMNRYLLCLFIQIILSDLCILELLILILYMLYLLKLCLVSFSWCSTGLFRSSLALLF